MQEGDLSPIELAMRSGPVTSILAQIELRSAIFRRWRSGEVAEDIRDALLKVVAEQIVPTVTLLPLDEAVLHKAQDIVEAHAVRTLDAIHLATAVIADRHARRHSAALQFCTADRRQADAATALFDLSLVVFVPALG